MSLGICACVFSGKQDPKLLKRECFQMEWGKGKVSSCVVASGCKVDGKCKEEREAHLLSRESLMVADLNQICRYFTSTQKKCNKCGFGSLSCRGMYFPFLDVGEMELGTMNELDS